MTNFSYRQAAVLLLLSFVGGAAAGGFAMSLYTAKTVSANKANTPKEWRDRYVSDLRNRLGLNDEQFQQLNTILDSTKLKYDAVKAQYKPEMDRIHQEQISSIRGMLKPEQATEYDKFRAEREAERKRKQQEQQQGAATSR
jgi:hypothetical protein